MTYLYQPNKAVKVIHHELNNRQKRVWIKTGDRNLLYGYPVNIGYWIVKEIT